jgi:NADH:ubiquinone oxidoreductase subunit C
MRLLHFFLVKQRFNSFDSFFPEHILISNEIYPMLIRKAKYLQYCCSKFLLNIAINRDLLEITVPKKTLLNSLYFLKNHSLINANILIDYTVTDFPGKSLRFEIILFVLSSFWNMRLKLRSFTNESISLLTVTFLYKVAFWQEREIWDMFGILFKKHGDLRRILTDYGFLGHPLRKDFPLSGYKEVFFNDFFRHIIQAPVSLAQEYRFFRFQNAWISL